MVIGSLFMGAATIPWNGKVCIAQWVASGRPDFRLGMRMDRLVANEARRAVFAHQGLAALARLAAAGGEIGPDVAATGDQSSAVRLALVVVAAERRLHVAA